MTAPEGPPPAGKKGFGAYLKQPVGPLPLGAWLVVVGVGLGIAVWAYRKQQQNKTAPQVVEDVSGNAGVGTGSTGGWVQTSPIDVPEKPPILTNEEWARQAINYLVGQGYPPTESDTAIRKYIVSDSLTTQEQAMVNIVLLKYGSPPQVNPPAEPQKVSLGIFQRLLDTTGAVFEAYSDETIRWIPRNEWVLREREFPGGPNALGLDHPIWTWKVIGIPAPPYGIPPPPPPPPPPAPPPMPAATNIRYVTVTRWPSQHGSLWGIAQSVYGNGAMWPRIFNANKAGTRRADGSPGMIHNPNLIYTGWRLIVP